MADTFEAQCDCELDSPGVLSHLPVEQRLKHWTDWALYLKQRIETHYRPRIAALEAENHNEDYETLRLRLQQAEAKIADLEASGMALIEQRKRAEAERDALKEGSES